MEKNLMYIAAKKIKGKWYGVAGCGPKGCLARAYDAFADHGFNCRGNEYKAYYADTFRAQKNYAGENPDFLIID